MKWKTKLPPYRQPGDKLRSSEWNMLIDSIRENREKIENLNNRLTNLEIEYDKLSNDLAFFNQLQLIKDTFIWDYKLFQDDKFSFLRNYALASYTDVDGKTTISDDYIIKTEDIVYSFTYFNVDVSLSDFNYLVYADVENVQEGTNRWEVLWITLNVIDKNNLYYMLLKTDGFFEISKKINGKRYVLLHIQTGKYTKKQKWFITVRKQNNKIAFLVKILYSDGDHKVYYIEDTENIVLGRNVGMLFDKVKANVYRYYVKLLK